MKTLFVFFAVLSLFGVRSGYAELGKIGKVQVPNIPPAPTAPSLPPVPSGSTPNLNEKSHELGAQAQQKQAEAKNKLEQLKININTAPKEDLAKLPGIGKAKADAIVAGRPYSKVEDLKKVKGIKSGVYEKLKNQITVD